ncbi:MAG: outer membrane lipoprotein-sorting protein, partial [Deltaproteobacteria bacterium]|nr:outer membrane lipoprotein-sorting protein [Deltaproteobacteria bacterium]
PKRNQITVVTQSIHGDRCMGSHFTKDDQVKHTRLGKHYKARLIRKYPGATTLYKVELTPRRNAPVAWGKIIYQLSKTGNIVLPVRADYYRRRASRRASRTITWRRVGRLGGRIIPTEMKIVLADKPGEHTRIRFRKIRFNLDVPGRRFSENQLRR